MSRKLEELKNKYGVSERTTVLIGRMDPTTNQKYVEWLFKVRYESIGNGKYRLNQDFPANMEDLVRDRLTWFERNLNGKIPADFRDINKFKTITEFISKVQELMTPSRSEIKNDVRIVFEDDNWKILIPLSFEASKLYGTGTKWCTTQKTYYDNYMRDGLLYYIVDKRINRKFGLPIPSSRGLKVSVSNFTFYNNEDCVLNINQIKLIYGNDFDVVSEKVRLDFVEQLKIKLRVQILENSKKVITKLKSDMSSVDIKDEELEGLLSLIFNRMSSIK
jgi:hypothetical protein